MEPWKSGFAESDKDDNHVNSDQSQRKLQHRLQSLVRHLITFRTWENILVLQETRELLITLAGSTETLTVQPL